jgi:hypothetical protein
MAEKYVVAKTEDFDRWWDDVGYGMPDLNVIPDAVVIRRQDIFAPPALDAYANGIRVAIEAMKSDNAGYNDKVVERLEDIAQYFHEQALLAWETDRKVPD